MRPTLLLIVLAFITSAAMADPLIYQKRGVAVGGHDPVAYFTLAPDQDPVKGMDAYSVEHLGAVWKFATAENMAKFQADPDTYMPQYGGYCAWAIAAKNKLVKTDPRDWKVYDGKLYLNYSAQLRAKWEANPEAFIPKGDANWAEYRVQLDTE